MTYRVYVLGNIGRSKGPGAIEHESLAAMHAARLGLSERGRDLLRQSDRRLEDMLDESRDLDRLTEATLTRNEPDLAQLRRRFERLAAASEDDRRDASEAARRERRRQRRRQFVPSTRRPSGNLKRAGPFGGTV